MPPSSSNLLSTSVYSQLCWNCIRKRAHASIERRKLERNIPRLSRRDGSTSRGIGQVRSLHHDSALLRQGALAGRELSSADDATPSLSQIPIRQRLKKWQEEHGNPMSDLLGFDGEFGIRSVIADTYGDSNGSKLDDPAHDAEDEFALPPAQFDEDISETGGVYMQMGDMVELMPSRAHSPPMLCIFVRRLTLSRQIQVITMRGKWSAVDETHIQFSVPGFLDKRLVEPVVPYLPSEAMLEEVLGQTHIIDPSVPRSITAPIVTALTSFHRLSEEIYRKHASVLDNAHDVLAHPTDLRFGTLERITNTLIGKDTTFPRMAAMYAVRKTLISAGMAFGIDRRSHRMTGVFQIRSKEQLKYVTTAVKWLRQYQDYEVALKLSTGHNEIDIRSTLATEGWRNVNDFVQKTKTAIIESRKHRDATYINHGAIGPSNKRFPITSEGGTMREIPTITFTESDRVLIRVLEYAGVQGIIDTEESLRSLLPLILRGTGQYEVEPYAVNLGRRIVLSFLLEIGVLAPHEDITLYDVNLLLPTSQHSKPLQQLAAALEHQDRSKVDLRDSFQDIRKDLKGTTAFAIDSAYAHEIDDALSITEVPGTDTAWVHVHIANPTAFIEKDSVFARMAAHLTQTFYSPDRVVPLLPNWLSQENFSLRSRRPCLTISALLNGAGKILDVDVQHGKLGKVVHIDYVHLPYLLGLDTTSHQSTERMIIGGDLPERPPPPRPDLTVAEQADLKLLFKFSNIRSMYRERNGSINFETRQNEISVHTKENVSGLPVTYPHRSQARKVEGDPIIAIYAQKFQNPFSHTRQERTVAEMMLLAGEALARWCSERNIPQVFRNLIPKPGMPPYHEVHDTYIKASIEKHGHITVGAGFRFIAEAGHGNLQTRAEPHPLLGLSMYIKATSPLRRYGDMIVHWQVEAALRHQARHGHASLFTTSPQDYLPYSEMQMDNIISRLSPRERLLNSAHSRTERHWLSHWFFRAFYYKEYPLPEIFQVRVLKAAQVKSSNKATNFSLAVWEDTGIVLKILPQSEEGVSIEAGDLWAARINVVSPFYPDTILSPMYLLHRDT